MDRSLDMARRDRPKAMPLVTVFAVLFSAFAAWDGTAEEQAGEATTASALQSSTKEEAEFEASIKTLISERQRLDEARARLAAMKLRIERAAKVKKTEEKPATGPKPTAPAKPKQAAEDGGPPTEPVEIPIDLEGTKSLMTLASSLYELGRYREALAYYEQIDASTLTNADVAWLTFQKGNCHFFARDYEKCERCMAAVTAKYAETIWSKQAAAVQKDIHFWRQREDIIKTSEQPTQRAAND